MNLVINLIDTLILGTSVSRYNLVNDCSALTIISLYKYKINNMNTWICYKEHCYVPTHRYHIGRIV